MCVPDTTGTLTASVAPCPSQPIAAPAVVSGFVISPSDYANLLGFDGPINYAEGTTLALTVAGFVVALYLLSLGVGHILRFIKET